MANKSVIPHMDNAQEPEWVVWLTVIIGLTIGWFVYHYATSKMLTVKAADSTISYPARWMRLDRKDVAFAATDLESGVFGPQVLVRQISKNELTPPSENAQVTPADPATAWSLTRGKDLDGYRVLGIKPTKVQGHDATTVESVFLSDAPGAFGPGTAPALMRADDTLVPIGDQVYILTFAAQSHEFSTFERLHRQLLDSWRLP